MLVFGKFCKLSKWIIPKALLEKVFEEFWVYCIFSLVANIWICRCLATSNIYSLANPPIHYHYLGWSNVFDYRTWICIFTSEFLFIFTFIFIFLFIVYSNFYHFRKKTNEEDKITWKAFSSSEQSFIRYLALNFFSYVSQVDRQRECFCCLFFFWFLAGFVCCT